MQKMIFVKSNLKNRISTLKQTMTAFAADHSGEGYLDMAMKILIIVVIGAAILAIMNTAIPNLFQSLITKISSQVNGITILPTT